MQDGTSPASPTGIRFMVGLAAFVPPYGVLHLQFDGAVSKAGCAEELVAGTTAQFGGLPILTHGVATHARAPRLRVVGGVDKPCSGLTQLDHAPHTNSPEAAAGRRRAR